MDHDRQRKPPTWWFTLLGVLSLVCLSPAYAAQLTSAQKQLGRQIKQHYLAGEAYAKKKLYQSAVLEFQSALRLAQRGARTAKRVSVQVKFHKNVMQFLYILGRTEQYATRYLAAYEYYLRCRQLAPASEAGKESARQIAVLLPQLQAHLHIQPHPPQASFQLRLRRPNHLQFTDRLPYRIHVPAGKWQLTLRHKGFPVFQKEVLLQPKQRLHIQVWACPHTRRIQEEACPTTATTATKPHKPHKQPANTLRMIGWGSLIFGIATAAASIALLSASWGQVGAFRQQQAAGALTNEDAFAQGRSLETLGDIGFVTTVTATAALATGVVLLVWPQPKSSPQKSSTPKSTPPKSTTLTTIRLYDRDSTGN